MEGFRQGLRELGYIEGQNINVEYRHVQLELLKDLVPRVGRVAVLRDSGSKLPLQVLEDAARTLSIEVRLFEVRQPSELADAFAAFVKWRAGAVLALPAPMIGNELVQLSTLGAVHRLPIIYLRREFAEAGGLVTYGPSLSESYRRAATYVHKILQGAKPAELPVEQPTQFDLIVNLKTAKAIGLEVPPSILVRATELIR
jgi:putative ABC transport system substrate-binding protein